jgi:hypothetical protein
LWAQHPPGRGGPGIRHPLTARRLGVIVLGVLVLHALVLDGFREAVTALTHAAPSAPLAALTVRAVALAVEPHAFPVAAAEAPHAPAAAPPARRSVRAVAPRSFDIEESRPVAADAAPALTPPARAEPAATPAGDAAAPTAIPAGDLPVYSTRLPPAFAFDYDLQRGTAIGSARLQWHPQDERYEARLAATSGGARLLAWNSSGGFDAAGIAPDRYTSRGRRSSTLAANFRRETGTVTFSGPAVEHALPPGAQDRLSWLLQLAAIAAADPARIGPEGRVSLLVVGARGDADVWTFVHVGEEELALPEGNAPTVRLRRDPARPYDTRAEVWLAPALHYLPVRVRLANGAEGDALQLTLREVLPAP